MAAAAVLAMTACEKENVFDVNSEEGMLNCESLNVDYSNGNNPTRATTANGVSVDDFTVDIIKEGEDTPHISYKYSKMPDVVTLPVGNYKVQAHYGEEQDAAWDNPCYFGEIEEDVVIKAGEITSASQVITCSLSNIKISVNVDDLGLGIVTDFNVDLKVGNSTLIYTNAEKGKIAYFRYIAGSNTIAAEFTGTVDGSEITTPIVINYENAAPGNAYSVNFTVTKPENGNPGTIGGGTGLNIDGTVTIKNETHTANPDEPNESIKDDPDRRDNSTQE